MSYIRSVEVSGGGRYSGIYLTLKEIVSSVNQEGCINRGQISGGLQKIVNFGLYVGAS